MGDTMHPLMRNLGGFQFLYDFSSCLTRVAIRIVPRFQCFHMARRLLMTSGPPYACRRISHKQRRLSAQKRYQK